MDNRVPTGKVPFLKEPGDINPPKPGPFQNMFALVHTYLGMVTDLADSPPGPGLIKLYSYRMGTLDFSGSRTLETAYLQRYSAMRTSTQTAVLLAFAHSLIAYNVTTLYQVLANTLADDITRGFGTDRCLNVETVHAINKFAQFHNNTEVNWRNQRNDDLSALVQTTQFNAVYPQDGGSTSATQAILRVLDVFDRLAGSGFYNQWFLQAKERRDRLIQTLRVVFNLGCAYYKLNTLRFSDEITKRSYDRALNISDLTLAAIPFDPTLVYTCSDEGSSISRWGLEYVQAMETVLLDLGGVRYAATLAVDASHNEGVNNV